MRPILPVLAALCVAALPLRALADCAVFVPYDATGNYHADVADRVAAAEECNAFDDGFDLNTYSYAQRSIVAGLVADQKLDEAYALAVSYFDTATARFEQNLLDPDHTKIILPAGVRHIRLRVHMQRMGVLAGEVESTFRDCSDMETLGRLLDVVNARIDAERESAERASKEGRQMIEQQLAEVPLVQWQEYFPGVETIEDVRNQRQVRDLLYLNIEPDMRSYMQDEYLDLLRSTVRSDFGRLGTCLAEAFVAHPDVVDMTPAQRLFNFSAAMTYIARNELLKDE